MWIGLLVNRSSAVYHFYLLGLNFVVAVLVSIWISSQILTFSIGPITCPTLKTDLRVWQWIFCLCHMFCISTYSFCHIGYHQYEIHGLASVYLMLHYSSFRQNKLLSHSVTHQRKHSFIIHSENWSVNCVQYIKCTAFRGFSFACIIHVV